ncbi:MAG TPA: hypothetical protein VEB21_14485 [Terriglobales bacterium]|nr:hypothetical protein [Terriglobales bacterium]
MSGIRQIPLAEWPEGVETPIALVAWEPMRLRKVCGLAFEESYDDLDAFDGALIEAESGHRFALVRRRHAPAPGTEIWSNGTDSARSDLKEVLDTLGLDPDVVTWVVESSVESESTGDSQSKVKHGAAF